MTKKMKFNMEKFWWYINERERIRIAKERGLPKPWTHDPIFQQYKFTNVFRQDDATTKVLLHYLQDSDSLHPAEIVFNIALFRLFNWGPTYEHCGGWCSKYVAANYKKKIKKYRAEGSKIFTGAYIVTSAGQSIDKVDLVCNALTVLWKSRNDIADAIVDFNTLKDAVTVLIDYPMIGHFVAYELACDMTYCKILNKAEDIKTWANPGPGAMRGLNRIFRGEYDKRPKHPKEIYQEEMRTLFKQLKSKAQKHIKGSEWPLDMRVIENALCETDKYLRLTYEEGKVRSKYPGV